MPRKFPVSSRFSSLLRSLGLSWICLIVSRRTRREMKLGFVLETAVALYLLLSPAQSLPLANTNSTTTVLMFQEVWGRSFCRTIEKLVEVVQEYPAEVEHIYSPSCVPLVRCAGCCGDENLECHPTRTSNVTMQLLKITPSEPGQKYVEMTFVEHQTCECRIKKPIVKVESKRQRGRGRRRKEKQKMKQCERCQIPRSVESLPVSYISTGSSGSNSWVVSLTCPAADEQSVCRQDKVQQVVCGDWWKHCCYTPHTMDMFGSQCNVDPNGLITCIFLTVITVSVIVICHVFGI